ncbi:MFS transporter [Alkalibacter mobilis]|uniref:MFS transporter n=1 Tax=Alkalibacter mobilis TaxID=2787712 RepID=UPI00189CEFAD|nr:MFS transporter [Alkalibacter mobilis]MBF7097362.1 MFS transporter [Alkalibacter mobilis]
MKKNNIKLAILSMSSLLMISMTASAILADIAAHFPQVELSVIQMVLAVPSLLAMFFALMSGPLSVKISKKSLVLFGLVSGFIGGMLGLTLGTTNVYILIFASVLIGVAQGINSTMTMALIADFFDGEERGTLMGLQSAFVNGGSMLILLTAGMLGGIKWNYSYLIYILFLPVFFIVSKNLPRQNRVHEESEMDGDGKLNGTVYFNCLIILVFGIMTFVFQSNIAIVMNSNGLGDASTTGLVNSFMTGIGMLTGVFYGKIRKVLKNFIIPFALVAVGTGTLLIYAMTSIQTIFLAAFLGGFAMSSTIPTIMFNVSNAVSASKSSMAIALANGSVSIGMFISPFIINPLAESLNPGSVEFKYMMSGIGLLTLAVVAFFGYKAIDKFSSKSMDPIEN